MSVKKLVLASVLKPVNDTRMYEKFAKSLSKIEGLEVHIAGQKINIPDDEKIHFHPLFSFKRLSIARIFASWKYAILLLKVKPKIQIVTTHELLIVSFFYKILFGGELYYDLQENYYRNILYTDTFPPLVRHVLALWVRLKEKCSRPFVDHYFLAERNYETEFNFSIGKSTVIENKFQPPSGKNEAVSSTFAEKKDSDAITFLFTGTISKEYGIVECIQLINGLHKINHKVRLLIIGYAAKKSIQKEVSLLTKDFSYIETKGITELVDHAEILQAIQEADYGLLPYMPNRSLENCIPTKIYEYQAYQLPMIIQDHLLFHEILPEDSAVFIDFNSCNPHELWEMIKGRHFYKNSIPNDIYWESEEKKLLTLFK